MKKIIIVLTCLGLWTVVPDVQAGFWDRLAKAVKGGSSKSKSRVKPREFNPKPPRRIRCSSCNGSGKVVGYNGYSYTCPNCNGDGWITLTDPFY